MKSIKRLVRYLLRLISFPFTHFNIWNKRRKIIKLIDKIEFLKQVNDAGVLVNLDLALSSFQVTILDLIETLDYTNIMAGQALGVGPGEVRDWRLGLILPNSNIMPYIFGNCLRLLKMELSQLVIDQ